ncbi:MAG: metal-dependent hydrolase [Polyangiaceae bacterium]|nr:metal-dependent hydrolase [Polyangiaceae bacterium]
MPRPTREPTTRHIPRRRVHFAFDPGNVPAAYYGDDLFLSLFMDSLSLLFPDGERYFVDSVRRYRDQIGDPELRERVLGFIGQEAMHSREHADLNAMLRAQGLHVIDAIEPHVKAVLGLARRLPRADQLAVTCALEHFTAILAEQLLGDERHREKIHPSVRPLWLWHAFEESEHKAVAYDVYEQVDGSYVRRIAVMLVTTAIFFAEVTHLHVRLLAARGLLGDLRGCARGIAYLWGRGGLFPRLVPAYVDYFRPGFHPDDRDTSALLDAWRERLFGPGGSVAPFVAGAEPRAA